MSFFLKLIVEGGLVKGTHSNGDHIQYKQFGSQITSLKTNGIETVITIIAQ